MSRKLGAILAMKIKFIVLCISVLFSLTALAEHPTSFSTAKKLAVSVYKGNEHTFYCDCTYRHEGKKLVPDWEPCGYKPRIPVTKKGKPNARAARIEWEHVMPAWAFGHQRQCWQEGGRKACKTDKEFKVMEADLHNLVPAIGELNGDRSNFKFTMIQGEPRKYGKCDFEIDFKNKLAEPPKPVRGNIARIYFYMRDQYKVKLSKQQTKLLEAWSKKDPVDGWEKERNQLIKKIQGNGNPYIH